MEDKLKQAAAACQPRKRMRISDLRESSSQAIENLSPCKASTSIFHTDRDSTREGPKVELASVMSSSSIERGGSSPISAAKNSRPICSCVVVSDVN